MRIGIACDGESPPAELVDLLEAAGLPAASLRGQRPPALLPAGGGVWLLATGSDVLRACDRGGLDLGVVGRDRLLEGRRGAADLLDLRCCRDELVYAVSPSAGRPGRRLRVATKYLRLTRRYFAQKSVGEYRLVESAGATEAAPSTGSADVIVDITTTGATLKANGLKVLRDGVILQSEAAFTQSVRASFTGEARAVADTLVGAF